ncbi:MAG: Tad domain-containing protein [Selenomonadaceae bacterium]|nr:Tad domain-containing protein [Selenomonadaceae bacterium]
MLKTFFNQRGQALVLYAFLIIVFFSLLGLVVDLGWYFYTVSRMQNAADAAVLVGARNLKESNAIAGVSKISLISHKDETFAQVYWEEKGANNSASNTTSSSGTANIDTAQSNEMAVEYVEKNIDTKKNLNTDEMDSIETSLVYDAGNSCYYYVVRLEETVGHLFLKSDIFPSMKAPVTAVAKLEVQTEDTSGLIDALEDAKRNNVIIGNWEIQNWYKKASNELLAVYKKSMGFDFYMGKWNFYEIAEVCHNGDDLYRTENINVKPTTAKGTAANGNKKYTNEDVQSLGIDFVADVTFDTKSVYFTGVNWDLPLGFDRGTKIRLTNYDNGKRVDYGAKAYQYHTRIHSTVNFNESYPERSSFKKENPNLRDILWVRIESEPMLKNPDNPNKPTEALPGGFGKNDGKSDYRVFSSVRQLTFNFNEANTDETERLLGIFYDGPERYNNKFDKHIRDSLPVILNFKADSDVFIYMPNSPAVIVNHGKTFRGFIVAKSFMRFKTKEDFENENYTEIEKGMVYQANTAVKNPYYGTYHYGLKFFDKYAKSTLVENVSDEQVSSLLADIDKTVTLAETDVTGTENRYYLYRDKTTNDILMSYRNNLEPFDYNTAYTRSGDNTGKELITYKDANGNTPTIKYTYKKVTREDGLSFFVDDYGNVQYAPLDSLSDYKNYEYSTFGFTTFTTHDYEIPQNLGSAILYSGK